MFTIRTLRAYHPHTSCSAPAHMVLGIRTKRA